MTTASPLADRHGSPLTKHSIGIILAMMLVAVVYLRWQGRVWWCEQHDFRPIATKIDEHNSQHLLDVYSLSHLLHGVIFFGVLWPLRRKISLPMRLVIATSIEVAWEMLENSPIIINRYRTATASLGYTGDSIVNSMGDIISYAAGFYLARKLGLWWSVGLFVVVELAMLWLIRDNLSLNVLMLLWPIKAVRDWQSGGM